MGHCEERVAGDPAILGDGDLPVARIHQQSLASSHLRGRLGKQGPVSAFVTFQVSACQVFDSSAAGPVLKKAHYLIQMLADGRILNEIEENCGCTFFL